MVTQPNTKGISETLYNEYLEYAETRKGPCFPIALAIIENQPVDTFDYLERPSWARMRRCLTNHGYVLSDQVTTGILVTWSKTRSHAQAVINGEVQDSRMARPRIGWEFWRAPEAMAVGAERRYLG